MPNDGSPPMFLSLSGFSAELLPPGGSSPGSFDQGAPLFPSSFSSSFFSFFSFSSSSLSLLLSSSSSSSSSFLFVCAVRIWRGHQSLIIPPIKTDRFEPAAIIADAALNGDHFSARTKRRKNQKKKQKKKKKKEEQQQQQPPPPPPPPPIARIRRRN